MIDSLFSAFIVSVASHTDWRMLDCPLTVVLVCWQGDGDYEIVPDLMIDEALRARMKKVR